MNYYSQHGEDFILDKVFKGKKEGYFVEVGCIDGKRFSNTLYFEELGWKGMCIEAHADYIGLIKKNRPNSTVLHCAVGEKDEDEVVFYANPRGSLSSLDKSTEEKWKRDYADYFTKFEEQRVNKRTLSTIFKKYNVNAIDVLSIDIEGYEVEALEGLDLDFVKPKVIVVEYNSNEHRKRLVQLLSPYNYRLGLGFGGNLFFSTDKEIFESLKKLKINNVKLVHTVHPLDQGTDSIQTVTLDFSSRYILKQKLVRLLKKIGLK